MLMGSGVGIANVTAELVRQGMYNETLVVLSSDNGGDYVSGSGDHTAGADKWGPSNNAPLRGRKCEPWEGGTRTVALVSGGWIPVALARSQAIQKSTIALLFSEMDCL